MQGRRILVADSRGADRHLRVTWHAEAGQFNLSVWHGDVCAGSVRVLPDDAARLIAMLADGMADAATAPVEVPAPVEPHPQPRWRVWLQRALHRIAA